MHWYVYPLAAFASVFLGHFLVDQVGQPIRSALRLRRAALERMVGKLTMENDLLKKVLQKLEEET